MRKRKGKGKDGEKTNEKYIPPPDIYDKYTLQAEGIRASFTPYGASITNLWVAGYDGVERDVVVGYDNATEYGREGREDHTGGVVGRYANRIANAGFDIDEVHHNVASNDGNNQLHGGPNGWHLRKFNVTSLSNNSITFSLLDPPGFEGFPGEVIGHVTYTLSPYTWSVRMTALSLSEKTPIMLSNHVLWNLDGFGNIDDQTALAHVLYMPGSKRRIQVGNDLVPTGTILDNRKGSVNDFYSRPKFIGKDIYRSLGNCGLRCKGYDNVYVLDKHDPKRHPIATLASPFSGIALTIFTNQRTVHLRTYNVEHGNMPLKFTQGPTRLAHNLTEPTTSQNVVESHLHLESIPAHEPEFPIHSGPKWKEHRRHNSGPPPNAPRMVQKHGCVSLDLLDWIDGINHPEWNGEGAGRQIFGPENGAFELRTRYVFGVVGEGNGRMMEAPAGEKDEKRKEKKRKEDDGKSENDDDESVEKDEFQIVKPDMKKYYNFDEGMDDGFFDDYAQYEVDDSKLALEDGWKPCKEFWLSQITWWPDEGED
ncbi:galactose mutarotase-like domain-containing protein [Kalaharituber pfeilii]|nr:galactose mutarotase-like domain-containing protein [Kalaharituber pfeilii]